MKRPVIVPTVTAYDTHEYRQQMERITPFAKRVHIDLMDGSFAPTQSPDLSRVWWPHELKADLHLMYQNPEDSLKELVRLKPRMVVVHNEAQLHHMHFASVLHKEGIKTGLALLQDTPVHYAHQIMHSFDHVLVFSGNLGYHGGEADLSMLEKVKEIHKHHPGVEVGWDGGISADNAKQLAEAGVDVLNVGGYIQKADDPGNAYARLKEILKI